MIMNPLEINSVGQTFKNAEVNFFIVENRVIVLGLRSFIKVKGYI